VRGSSLLRFANPWRKRRSESVRFLRAGRWGIAEFAPENRVALETPGRRMPTNLWTPSECSLCAAGVPLEIVGNGRKDLE